jgi:hypothetical protein
MYIECQSFCPFVVIGSPPSPFPASDCVSSPPTSARSVSDTENIGLNDYRQNISGVKNIGHRECRTPNIGCIEYQVHKIWGKEIIDHKEPRGKKNIGHVVKIHAVVDRYTASLYLHNFLYKKTLLFKRSSLHTI